MSQPLEREHIFAQSLPGLEGVLESEARALGRARCVPGGVELEGPRGLHAEALLVLRVAERILLRLFEVEVRRWSELQALLQRVSLDRVAAPGSPVALETAIRVPGVPESGALRRLLGAAWRREVVPARREDGGGPRARLLLRMSEGSVSLSVDASGEPLHRRGWRQELSRAPLRETLAAGVLALAGHALDRALRDPVCGSGTLVIEAALIARCIAPGLGRSFAAEDWPDALHADWSGRRERLRSLVRPRAAASIVGSDINAGALGVARRNARRAGVLEDVRFERVEVAAVAPVPGSSGLLVGNLPYGVRVGAPQGLASFDSALRSALSGPFRTWRRALLVDDALRLERAAGRAPDRVHRLVNGGIPVVLGVWDPEV